jgi:hypothetical protein
VVAEVLAAPALIAELVDGLSDADALVRMRCADALEKAVTRDAGGLRPFKPRLLALLAAARQQDVRWHLAQLGPRLALDGVEWRAAVVQLRTYLEDRSRVVQVYALQALADLAVADADLRGDVVPLLERGHRRPGRAQPLSPSARPAGWLEDLRIPPGSSSVGRDRLGDDHTHRVSVLPPMQPPAGADMLVGGDTSPRGTPISLVTETRGTLAVAA